MKRSRRLVAVLMCAAVAVGAAACSSDDETSTANTTTTASSSNVAQPVGAGCSAIPADGAGSSEGMAEAPAATAASNNPVLSTLVTAVTEAGLVDTLNDTSAEYTVFAPANSAFEKIPAADLQALLADKATLTDVLTYHVYAGQQYSIDELPDSLTMVNGGTVEIAPDGETAEINGESVVVCGNVETANATVHIIDTVLSPAGGASAEPVGAACSAIPAEGAGSSAGMAEAPAATAASNNPVLSTLVTAVTAAGLVDTLNDTSAQYTIFAPANAAFEKIPAADLQALLADQTTLTDILTYHVYAGQEYTLDELPATLAMVNGDSVQIAPDGETAEINGESVVICGNVETANATVHIIDTVLMPPT